MIENDSAKDSGSSRSRKRNPLQSLFLVDVIKDKESGPVFYWFLSTLIFGMVVYHWLEGWAYLDALYFSLITMATIGYGDLVPTTPASKAFTMFFAVNGIAILFALFDRIRAVRAFRYEDTNRQRSDQVDP